MKGIRYNDIKNPEEVYELMLSECSHIHWIKEALGFAWIDFAANKFKYDGATFVQERNDEFFEVAAFIHDWINTKGYVGKIPDLYFIKIMLALNYGENIIFERCKWMQYTWLNVINHKVFKPDFIANDLPLILK